jgi:membrane-bound lytic murein transglycosylase A
VNLLSRAAPVLALALLSACATRPPTVVVPPTPPVRPAEPPPAVVPPPTVETRPLAYPALRRANWGEVEGWPGESAADAWVAFLRGCKVLAKQTAWNAACAYAATRSRPDDAGVRAFFEARFLPYRATNEDGSDEGLVTGYYEPLLRGDRVRSPRASYPVYGVPADLVTVDLAGVYPELKNMRLRGKLAGKKLVPYPARRDIDAGNVAAPVLGWVEDPVELFFLQIQGSGRIALPDGGHLRLGYADQNGHPYKSVGKLLVERGELKLEQASMQGIKRWGEANPDKLPGLLAENPSYVFFRELPDDLPGPLGALGVPLAGERAIAIDPRFVPLGAPVFLDTTRPNSDAPLQRLVMAQDTGGAIRGGVRADYFWGFGPAAGEEAGKMKQRGRVWVLLPREFPLMREE